MSDGYLDRRGFGVPEKYVPLSGDLHVGTVGDGVRRDSRGRSHGTRPLPLRTDVDGLRSRRSFVPEQTVSTSQPVSHPSSVGPNLSDGD